MTGEDCGSDSTGGHYNPAGHPTGGELGMLFGALANSGVPVGAGAGSVVGQYTSDKLTLFGPDSIIGRSIVIHKGKLPRTNLYTE